MQQYTNIQGAVIEGNLHAVQQFIHAGADVNIQDKDGDSLLHLAVIYEQLEVLSLLLDNHADPNVCNQDNMNVFCIALSRLFNVTHLAFLHCLLTHPSLEDVSINAKAFQTKETLLHQIAYHITWGNLNLLEVGPTLSLLMLWEADRQTTDLHHRTPEDIAPSLTIELDKCEKYIHILAQVNNCMNDQTQTIEYHKVRKYFLESNRLHPITLLQHRYLSHQGSLGPLPMEIIDQIRSFLSPEATFITQHRFL